MASKQHLMAAGCSETQAEMLSCMSEDHAEQFSMIDPTTRDWLLGMMERCGKAAMPVIIKMIPALVKGDWKAAIEIALQAALPDIPLPPMSSGPEMAAAE